MVNWTKTTFNGTIITSQFLNDLQDFIRARAPKLVPYDETNESIPLNTNTYTRTTGGIMFGRNDVGTEFEVMTGDILVGSPSGNLASVIAVSGTNMTIKGLGIKI